MTSEAGGIPFNFDGHTVAVRLVQVPAEAEVSIGPGHFERMDGTIPEVISRSEAGSIVYEEILERFWQLRPEYRSRPRQAWELTIESHKLALLSFSREARLTRAHATTIASTAARFDGHFPDEIQHIDTLMVTDTLQTPWRGNPRFRPYGEMHPAGKYIELSPRALKAEPYRAIAELGASALQMVTAHELAHIKGEAWAQRWVEHGYGMAIQQRTVAGPLPFLTRRREYITEFSELGPEEDSCEARAAYVLDREYLARRSPRKLRLIAAEDAARPPSTYTVRQVRAPKQPSPPAEITVHIDPSVRYR